VEGVSRRRKHADAFRAEVRFICSGRGGNPHSSPKLLGAYTSQGSRETDGVRSWLVSAAALMPAARQPVPSLALSTEGVTFRCTSCQQSRRWTHAEMQQELDAAYDSSVRVIDISPC
jgi:hypothetical protein